MVCFDSTNALNAVIGVALIMSGGMLMLNADKTARTLGSVSLGLGYLVLALAVADRDISSLRDLPNILMSNTSTLVAVASAVLIVTGKMLNYYHVQSLLERYDGRVVKELVKDLPMINNVLIGLGASGLLLALVFSGPQGREDPVKGGLGIVAVGVMLYSNNLMLKTAGDSSDSANNVRLAHLASYALMVIAVGYSSFC